MKDQNATIMVASKLFIMSPTKFPRPSVAPSVIAELPSPSSAATALVPNAEITDVSSFGMQ
eukprot:CAMPEP_0206421310 /NCGR_PEP_ID=MMETSP0324_2-20121206/1370_1 /ASSEMBLY_ACC=CAM_ASM_000836 /TAXON_ID=2866 /ORGANISM="Crypthecodinium cohnii, Strain Seligo" /LENGTH=60 /DNA_ID=CAMNT_0053885377 /DNA_START=42 /DNA_END=224 /DNA_ORIENTATION=+